MPTKDPVKLKAARKRADEKRKGTRFLNWAAVIYPDSAPADWRERLDELHIEWAESPLHDRDVNADGEPKKPHIHIVLSFESVQTFQQVSDVLKPLNCPHPQYLKSLRGMLRYFVHADNPEKAQYSRADIIAHGGMDVEKFFAPTAGDVNIAYREMQDFVIRYGVAEFAELMIYAAHERVDWYEILINKSYAMESFMRSLRFCRNRKFANPMTGEVYQDLYAKCQNGKAESGDRAAEDSSQGSAQADRASGAERP